MQRDIFISYSRIDFNLVKQIKEEIEKTISIECWMDLEGIESGSPQFTKDIVDGINNCKVFLFMLSEHSQKSEFALRELNYAYKKKKMLSKHVVIVNINDCKLTDEFELLYGLTDTILWSNSLQHDKLMRDLKKWVKPFGAFNDPISALENHLKWSLESDYYYFCYSTRNFGEVLSLKKRIEENGKHVWISPEGIPPGTDRSLIVKTALLHAKQIVLLLSRYSAMSRWVANELELATRNGAIKKIKIVICDDYEIEKVSPELQNFINNVQTKYRYSDITTSPDLFNKFLND